MRHTYDADSVELRGAGHLWYATFYTDEGDEITFRLPESVARDLAFAQTLPVRLAWTERLAARAAGVPGEAEAR